MYPELRHIAHLDADAFFASVEQAADSRLRGKPVAVGGEKRGIIASASYEARKFGIFTPMPTVRARKLCPKLIVLPGDFEKYERFSQWMFSYAYDFTPDVEVCSIDEGYFDLSGSPKPAVEVAGTIQRAIRDSLKISVSEGVAANKLVSQIASKLNKPAAFTEVPTGRETLFLHPLPNHWLPGVGPHTATRLNAAGLARIGQIAATPTELLEVLLGRQAPVIREFANGIDDRPVVTARAPAKSYSRQETFAEDITDEERIEAVLRSMADRLMAEVRAEGKSIRTVTVKVRYNDMAEDQAGESLLEPTDLETDVYARIRPLLREAWRRRVSLRMVSLRFSNVYEGIFRVELALDDDARGREARRRLAAVVDLLREEHGRGVLLRGHDLLLRPPDQAPPPRRGRTFCLRVHVRPEAVSTRPAPPVSAPPRRMAGVPLQVHSFYSFLDSTLSIDQLVKLAANYEMPALALADTGNLHGAVEFYCAAKKAGIKPVMGAEVRVGGRPLRLFVENATGYHNLCRLLSQAGAGGTLDTPALEKGCGGLVALGVDPALARLFPGAYYLAVGSAGWMRRGALAENGASGWHRGLPLAACPVMRYARPEDRWKYDIVQSIRTRTLLRQAHAEKRLDGAFHFRSPEEWRKEFGAWPRLLDHTAEIAGRCSFDMPLGRPQFPAFAPPDGASSCEYLRKLVMAGARRRYGERAARLQAQLDEELTIIGEVGYEDYFLVVWDLLQECHRRGIAWITRGSAADSLVCYCLGISDVCPIRFDLYFRRFLNRERMQFNKLPDIDLDFAHDQKDAVIDLVFEKYGATHAAVVGGFSTFQARSAVADVAKVLGVSEYQIRRFTEHFPWMERARDIAQTLAQTQECRDLPLAEEPYRSAVEMAEFLDGFPRYPKMHPCGVVLSRQPMTEITPVFRANKGYPTTHFDMDSVEAIGLVKMDILAQGGLAVMRDVRHMLEARGVEIHLDRLEPWKDPQVWELIASGGARAVHHIESPAMIGLCRQTGVQEIDGLVAIVSVIRPGAANEHKKLRFTRRYMGLEPVTYPHPSLEPCLKSTFGLVVYEEHVLQMCEVFAGLPPGRADVLRRALGKRKQAVIDEIRGEFFAAARQRGHGEEKIQEVWDLVEGFAGYAFCKAHSTAYGVEAYQSAWLKRYYPVEFMAAVLTNGKGFYHPLVYILECHRLGIPILPPWINDPGPAFTVHSWAGPPPPVGPRPSHGQAIRVPVTRMNGLTERTAERLVAERARGEFASLKDFYRRVEPSSEEMEGLIRAGAFDGFGATRTAQFWEFQFLRQAYGHDSGTGQGWLFPPVDDTRLPSVPLREPTRREKLDWEADLFGYTVSGHPLELHDHVSWDTYCPVSRLGEFPGQTVVTCGLVIEQRLHHQVTGEPMKFLTLADWTGMVETELFAPTYRSYGLATVRYPVLEVTATVEPYENGRGFSLRVHRAGPPRLKA